MSAFSHFVHAVITILFFPWALVWLCCAISASNSRRKRDDRRRDEELQLLRRIANRGDK
jgi:predicted acyltransferase